MYVQRSRGALPREPANILPSHTLPRAGRNHTSGAAEVLTGSFFATLEAGSVNRRGLPTHAEPRREVFAFVERIYNIRGLHSAREYMSRADVGQLHHLA